MLSFSSSTPSRLAQSLSFAVGAVLLLGLALWASPAQAQQPDRETVFDHLKEEGRMEQLPPSVLREKARRNPGALTPEQRRRLRAHQRKLANTSKAKARSSGLTFKDPVQSNGAAAWPNSDFNFRPDRTAQRAGDVNGDGINDYIYVYTGIADGGTSTLSDRTAKTFLKFGGGDFSSSYFDELYERNLQPVGNFVGDSKADAIEIRRNGYRILEGTSSGYSGGTPKPALPSRVFAARMAPVDLDEDGFDDVVFPSQTDSTITVLYGAPEPGGVTRQTYSPFFRDFGNSFSYATGNVDSTTSSDDEIVRVAGFTNRSAADSLKISIFDVDGSRNLVRDTSFRTAPISEISGIPSDVTSRSASELTPELLNVDGADLQEIILKDNRGFFTATYTSTTGGDRYDNTALPQVRPGYVGVGDLNGDGRADFFLPADTSVAFGPQTLSDGLTPDASIPTSASERINLFDFPDTQLGNRLGDVNDDGDDEFIAAFDGTNQFGARLLEFSSGSLNGTDFSFSESDYGRQNVITTQNVGDWNGDGTDDAAFVFRDGRVELYFDDPATSLTADVTFTTTGEAFSTDNASIAAGDFTGNGQRNLAVGWKSNGQAIAVYEAGSGQSPIHTIGLPDLGIQETNLNIFGASGNSTAATVANVGDVNADGTSDLAVAIPAARVQSATAAFLFLGQSSLSNSPDVTIDYSDDGASSFVGTEIEALGDVNDDGIDDFAVGDGSRPVTTDGGNASGGIYVHFGRDADTPSFGAPDEIITPRPPFEGTVTNFPWGMTTGDFDGDGTPDLAAKAAFFEFSDGRGADAIYIYEGGPFFDGGEPDQDIRLPAFLRPFDTGDFATRNLGELTTLPPRAGADTTADRLLVGTNSPTNALILSPRVEEDRIEGFAPSALLRAPDQNDGLGSSSLFLDLPRDFRSAIGDFGGEGRLQAVLPQPGNPNFRGSPAYTYPLGPAEEGEGELGDQPVAAETRRLDVSEIDTGTGTVQFATPRVKVVFSDQAFGEGDFTVGRFAGRPFEVGTVDQDNVSSYYLRIGPEDSLGTQNDKFIGEGSRIRFDVSVLPGISDPTAVTVYQRELPDAGSFRALSTTYDANANELVAQGVSGPGEFVFASDTESLTRSVATPTRLSATAASDSVTVTWDASGDADQYFVYRSTSPIEWAAGPSGTTPFDTTAAGTTALTDTSAQVGTTYYYRVTAATSDGTESGFSPQSRARPSFVLGSPSGDDRVTAGDASLVRRFSVGLIDFDRAQRLAGDVSGDGTVNAADASLIQQFIVGLIDTFPADTDGAKDQTAPLAEVSGTVAWGEPTTAEGRGTEVPIRLEGEPTNVRSVQLRATYDTSAVTIAGVTADGLPAGWRATHNVDAASGTVRIALSGTTPTDAGPLATLALKTASADGQATLSGEAALYTAAEQSIGSVTLDTAPENFRVEENYPNPFRETTTIEYALPEQTTVQVAVYDLLGRRVRTLVDGKKSAGEHTVTVEATSLSSGTYFYRVQTEQSTETGRMVIIR